MFFELGKQAKAVHAYNEADLFSWLPGVQLGHHVTNFVGQCIFILNGEKSGLWKRKKSRLILWLK